MKTHTVNGARLAVVDRGAGIPLLLVHGFPLDHTMWAAQIEALSETCRVIAPDLRGFGASDPSEGKVTMQQMADDLAGLLDAVGVDEPVVFCGLSMGGYVAWEFWRCHAERLRALILCDTRAQADAPEVAAGRLETADQVLAEGPECLAAAMIPKLFAPATVETQPQVVESLRATILRTAPAAIAAAARGMAERRDFVARLAEIDCPTLVLVGEQDAISPVEEMRAMAETIPAARFVQIADAGHMSPMEKPDEVSAAMAEFVAGLDE